MSADFPLLIPVFLAGVLTFLAPCTFPFIPAYLGFISGVGAKETGGPARKKIFLNGLSYITGFSLVFILLGTLAGFLGTAAGAYYRIWLSRLGGAFVIMFGIYMLGIFGFFPSAMSGAAARKTGTARKLVPGKPFSSFLLGSSFAFGWTPCVGPLLGSALLLASDSATAVRGTILLTAFSAGLAAPFLAITAGWGYLNRYTAAAVKYGAVFSAASGLILIVLGLLLLTDRFSAMIQWGYWIFRFFNYEALLKYF